MRRPTTYEQTLERLKTQGTREQECFSRAVTALRGKGTAAEFSATITDARAAIDKLVQDPELFTSRRAAVAGDATSLMAALGYAPLEGLPGRYEFRASTTPVVLRRLALASASLEAALREEPTRRAAQRFDHLPPEPPLGVSGTRRRVLPVDGVHRVEQGRIVLVEGREAAVLVLGARMRRRRGVGAAVAAGRER